MCHARLRLCTCLTGSSSSTARHRPELAPLVNSDSKRMEPSGPPVFSLALYVPIRSNQETNKDLRFRFHPPRAPARLTGVVPGQSHHERWDGVIRTEDVQEVAPHGRLHRQRRRAGPKGTAGAGSFVAAYFRRLRPSSLLSQAPVLFVCAGRATLLAAAAAAAEAKGASRGGPPGQQHELQDKEAGP